MTLGPREALATIREAYGYVERYQQSVLDAFAMIDRQLAAAGFVLWQWESSSAYRSSAKDFRGLQGRDLLPLLDLEISWVHAADEQRVDEGIGTYVIVRHVADTVRAPGGDLDQTTGDSVLHAIVVRPAPGFSKDEFRQPWGSCIANHFGVDRKALVSLKVRGPEDHGSYWLHVLSLAMIAHEGEFQSKFVDLLVQKARQVAA